MNVSIRPVTLENGQNTARSSMPGGILAPGVHLLGIPNANFEDGLVGWTATATGSGTAAAIDTTAGNQVTGVNSAKLVTAAAADTSAVTSPLFPVGAGIPFKAYARAKSSGAKGTLTLSVTYYDRTKTILPTNSTATLTLTALLPTTFSEYGGTASPPATACYATLTVSLGTAADTMWLDELRVQRLLSFNEGLTGPATRTHSDKLADRLDVRDYLGVDLTGANDMTTLLQRAAGDAMRIGTKLWLPEGNYPGG